MTRRFSQTLIENMIFLGAAFLLSNAPMRMLSSGADSLEGDWHAQAVLGLCYSSLLVIAFLRFRWTFRVMRLNPAILALLILAFLSPFWAETPDLVARRTIAVAGTTLFGIVLATRLTFEEQLRLLRWACRIAAVLSLLVLIVAPSLAFSPQLEGTSLRGIFNHKNHLGATMALGFLMERYVPEARGRAKLLRSLSLGLYFVLLLLSRSMTSVVALALALVTVYAFRVLHARCRLPLPVLFTLLLFGGGIILAIEDSVTQLLGRSSDLTGRTELWSFTLDMIAKHPLLGFGFSGFWMGASDESLSVQTQIGWTPIYSHNGYLEILISLGLVGLLLCLVIVGTGIKRVLGRPQIDESINNMWPLAFFTFFLIHNIAECTIFLQNCLEWSLCVAVVVGSDSRLLNALAAAAEQRTARVPVAEYA
jgi:exopolysaccharide production protein ExoQ